MPVDVEAIRKRLERWRTDPEAAVRELLAAIEMPIVGSGAQDPTALFVREVTRDVAELLSELESLVDEHRAVVSARDGYMASLATERKWHEEARARVAELERGSAPHAPQVA
jgi:hypothetical protein